MIRNDDELKVTQERIVYFQSVLQQLRETARPQEFPLVAGSYRSEIERMQREMLDYLTRPLSELAHAG